MRTLWSFLLAGIAILVTACSSAPDRAQSEPHILVFSHTTGYRHASIEPGIDALQALGAAAGYRVTASEDPAIFSETGLAGFDAIVLLSSTTNRRDPSSEWLQGERRDALQEFVRRGGGIVGIHAAADSHFHWPWYRQMIGGVFARHPAGTPEGRILVTAPEDPSARALPPEFLRRDEWYYFNDFRADVRLIAVFDPVSIGEPGPGTLPLSWRHEFEGGRVFYTGMGHTDESFSEPLVLAHLAGGLHWAVTGED